MVEEQKNNRRVLTSGEQAMGEVLRLLHSLDSDHWLVTITTVSNDGELHTRKITWDFPTVRFLDCLASLSRKLVEEVEELSKPSETVGVTDDEMKELREIIASRRKKVRTTQPETQDTSITPTPPDFHSEVTPLSDQFPKVNYYEDELEQTDDHEEMS